MFKLVKKSAKKPISLRNHFNRRNKVLVKRRAGGHGDILMQRMIFEDFNKYGLEVTFTCPHHYLEMIKNHPFVIAKDIETIDESEYGTVFDVTTACRVHEMRHAPNCKTHRSDIWASHCGVELAQHNMFLFPISAYIEACQNDLKRINPDNKPIVILATKSTDDAFGIAKSLTEEQITQLVYKIRELNFLPIAIHGSKQDIYNSLGVVQLTNLHSQSWIALVSLADYVISIDTATFHMAGGLTNPNPNPNE